MRNTPRVRVVTNASGGVLDSYDYMPFGEQFSTGTGTVPNRYGGTDYDSESNLFHATNRQYPAAQGRWLSPDPLAGSAADPQSLNRYTYVKNSPLVFGDPLGLYGMFATKPPGVNVCIWTASTDKPNSDQDSAQSSSKGPGGPSADESSSEEAAPAPDCVGFLGYMSIAQVLDYYDGYDSASAVGTTMYDSDGNPIKDMGLPGAGMGTIDGVDTIALQFEDDPSNSSFMGNIVQNGYSAYSCLTGASSSCLSTEPFCAADDKCYAGSLGAPGLPNPEKTALLLLQMAKGNLTTADSAANALFSAQTSARQPSTAVAPRPPSQSPTGPGNVGLTILVPFLTVPQASVGRAVTGPPF